MDGLGEESGLNGSADRSQGEGHRVLRVSGVAAGTARVPTSKSIAQRALVCAMLAEGETRFAGLPDGEDVVHARRLCRDFRAGARVLRAGESATLARLAAAAGAFHGPRDEVEIQAAGTLRRRTSEALVDALARCGVGVVAGPWPLRTRVSSGSVTMRARERRIVG